jgi:hypothetical protein
MIKAFQLCHPQSAQLLSRRVFNTELADCTAISCGTTNMEDVDYSESNDFFPTYASWNSVLFEASVIMTIWEHADQLIGDNDVAIIHSDIQMHFKLEETWGKVNDSLLKSPDKSVGLTAPAGFMGVWNDWEIPAEVPMIPAADPMKKHAFDNGIYVWDFINKYDPDIYEWAMEEQPRMIYSHQFACSRKVFDLLGHYLCGIAGRLRLIDAGFWTPHMFERLIALFLARHGGDPLLTTAFWHHHSSAVSGPGKHSFYGPRPFKHYKIKSKVSTHT